MIQSNRINDSSSASRTRRQSVLFVFKRRNTSLSFRHFSQRVQKTSITRTENNTIITTTTLSVCYRENVCSDLEEKVRLASRLQKNGISIVWKKEREREALDWLYPMSLQCARRAEAQVEEVREQ